MKAIRIHEFGDVGVLEIDSLPRPEPAAGEVLIEIAAASVNPVDGKIREGKFPAVKAEQLPVTLGRDVAGRVAARGAGADGLREGDAVFAMLPQDRGGYAEWVCVPERLCARAPDGLDMVQAASVPLVAITAWQGLFTHGGLKAGQRVLIHGAAGGVGGFAVQFAKVAGAEVFATAAGEDRAYVEGLGADRVIDYRNERFEDVAEGMDLVYDLVGGETEDRSWQVLKRGGTLVSTLKEPDATKAAAAGARAMRYTAQPDGALLAKVAALISEGKVKVAIDKVFPLEDAAKAESHLENDHVVGKVVLRVADPGR